MNVSEREHRIAVACSFVFVAANIAMAVLTGGAW